MNGSKQRILDAINHIKYDRVPVDFWSTGETDDKLLKHLGLNNRAKLPDKFNVDIVYIEGPEYTGYPLTQYPDGNNNDIWGVRRKTCFSGEGDKKQSHKTLWKDKKCFS